jgi:predicted DNA-binding antitoxin AbrB/MazE fold protein
MIGAGMTETIRATFHNGVFVPESPVRLPDGTKVNLMIEGSRGIPPQVTDPIERKRILARVVQRLKNNPLPVPASSIKREDLHERR